MNVNVDMLVSMTEANRHLSNVLKKVDKSGTVVILKNNTPRYVILGIEDYGDYKNYKQAQCELSERGY